MRKTAVASAVVALLAVASARAADTRFSAADRAIGQAEKVLADYQKCANQLARLTKEADQERRASAGRSQNAALNPYGNDMVTLKMARAARQRRQCESLQVGAAIDAADLAVRATEPKSMPGFAQRRQQVDQLRKRSKLLVRSLTGGGATTAEAGSDSDDDSGSQE